MKRNQRGETKKGEGAKKVLKIYVRRGLKITITGQDLLEVCRCKFLRRHLYLLRAELGGGGGGWLLIVLR